MDAVDREWCFGVRCLQQQCSITWSLGDCYPNDEIDQKSLLGLLSPLAFRFSLFANRLFELLSRMYYTVRDIGLMVLCTTSFILYTIILSLV